jgi:hypothetical protein
MKVFVLMENSNPVGVTKSKTKAEKWLFSPDNDYLTFEMEDVLKSEEKAPAAPVEEKDKTPQEHLLRNVDKLETQIEQADKKLKENIEQLKKFKRKSSVPKEAAVNYKEMFKKFLEAVPKFEGAVNQEISWAKEHLEKKDRIVWYLRWIRLGMIQDAENTEQLPKGTLHKELDALKIKSGKQYTPADIIRDDWRFKRDLQHYMSVADQEMQSKQFGYETPFELMTELKTIDDKFKEKVQEDARLLEPQEDDKVLIKFPDGWAWWALNRGVCSEEAEAMGHCGNQGMVTGNQIISLREPKSKGGKNYWVPHLTFILDKDTGMLGEMKGRGNEKPAARYHPYIIELLEGDRIKGIRGGGYQPSHNFAMNDLSEEDRTKLEEDKPELMTLRRYMAKNKNKIDDYVIEKTQVLLGLNSETYDEHNKGWTIETWKSVENFVEERGNRQARWLMKYETGRETLDVDYVNENDALDFIDRLPDAVVKNIGLSLEQNRADELKKFRENYRPSAPHPRRRQYTWEPDNSGDIKDFIKYLEEEGKNSEVMDNLRTAYRYGVESGTLSRMSEVLTRAVEEATDSFERIKIVYEGNNVYYGKIFAVLKLVDAVDIAMECEDEGSCTSDPTETLETLKVEASEQDDYYDFDEKYAIKHLIEVYGEAPEVPEKTKKPVENKSRKKKKKLKSSFLLEGDQIVRHTTNTDT